MDQMVRNDIACNCIPIVRIAFGTHTFHFNCFFDDLNCIFTQIRCLSRVLPQLMGVYYYKPCINIISSPKSDVGAQPIVFVMISTPANDSGCSIIHLKFLAYGS